MPSLAGFDNFIQSQNAQPTGLGPTTQSGNFNLDELIATISPQYGIDPEVTRALVRLESGGNPRAIPIDPVTKQPLSSAKGLMQLIDGTAREMGVKDPFDPVQNLHGGLKYLKQHLDATGGDLDKALRMYNQGPKGNLASAQGYVDTFKKFYGKDLPIGTAQSQVGSVDIGAALKDVIRSGMVSKASTSGAPPFINPSGMPSAFPDPTEAYQGISESALGRGFGQALNGPQPQTGKLPFGIENKGGTVAQLSKDILYGLPEGVMNLGAGLIGLPSAAIGSVAKLATSGSLEKAGDTFNEIAHTAMGTPQTATAQYMMKPFEVIFGGILNSGAEVVKDLNPNATPEELDSKVKATQYLMNLAMVAPMFKGAVRGRGKVDAENPAKSLDQHEISPEVVEQAKAQIIEDPNVAPEVKAQVGEVTPDLLQSIKLKAAQSVAKERVQKVGVPEAKFPENQSIVEGLLTEVELREGRAKTAMRKAAQIVAAHDGDIALADLENIKGINVKGSTGKTIARLIEERDAAKKVAEKDATGVGEDVPFMDEAPVVEPVKSLSEIPDVKSQAEATMYGKSEKVLPAGDMPLDSASVASLKGVEPESYGKLSSFFDDNSYEPLNEFVKLIRESELEGEVLERMARITGTPIESLTKGAIKIGHGTTKNLVLSLIEEKRRGLLERKVEAPLEVPPSEPVPKIDFQSLAESIDPDLRYVKSQEGIPGIVDDAHQFSVKIPGSDKETGITILGEVTPEKVKAAKDKILEGYKEKVEEVSVEVPKVAEDLPISEFDSTSKAKEEGYTFPDKARYASLEKAQARAAELGEGHEVVKVKGKYKVAKFEETPVTEFPNVAAVERAGLELMSEVPAERVQFESPSTGEGFGIAKVGDKYYRTSIKVEMPRKGTIAPVEVPDMVGDGVSMADYQALLKFTDEATLRELEARNRVKELAPTVKAIKSKPIDPTRVAQLQEAYQQWKDSYVTKCNIAQTSKKSKTSKKKVTKESLAIVDDNFKTFDSMEAANEWMEATGAVGELIPDPLTGKVSFMNTEKLKGLDELDIWDEGVEQLTGRSERLLDEEAYPDMELSETGTGDLWSILNNERGSIDVPDARALIDLVNSTVAKAKKMGKSVDEYLVHIGTDQVMIDAFKAAMAQVPQMKQELKDKDPTGTAIFYPEGKVVAQTINKNKNGEVKSVGPPITETLANKVMSVDRDLQWGTDHMRKDPETGKVRVEHTSNGFERAMQATEVKINSFRAAGLQELYSQWREAKSAAEREKGQVKEWLDGLEKQIAPERREAFSIAAYADMKSVKEALNAMGITEVPQLTPKESAILEQLLDYTRKFRDRSNFVRTHTGQKAIPKLLDMNGRENYLPLMRDLNVLRDMGLTEGLTISDSKKLGELSKKFNGMFNPNSKKRNVSDIPIELDPFNALRKHAEYGLDEIHISPVAALAKDLANLKLPRVDGVKGKMSLSDWNPYLSRMLSRWSDQIVGKDVVATAMANANPFFSWVKDRIAKNLVVATIGGSLRTVLVQPTSYMIGIPTMTDLRSTGYGIWKLMSERPFGKSNARQHSSVLNIREADYNFKELADYIQQGKMSGTMGYLAEKSLAPMKWVDSIMAEAGWNAARYYGEKRLKLQGKELYRFADDVVERTQGLGIKGAVSDIQSSAATKWLTLLQTFAIADFNLIARDVLGIKNPEMNQSKTIIRVAKYTAATILAGQLYKMIGLDNVVPDPIGAYEEAKKEGKGNLKSLGAAAGELLEKVPIIGGSAKYGSSLFGIAGEWADILPEAGEKFSASLDWNKLTPKQKSYNIRLMARAVGLTMGIPMTNQILKSINSAYKGGDPWEVILGVYKEKGKRKGGLRPEIPRPPSIPKPF